MMKNKRKITAALIACAFVLMLAMPASFAAVGDVKFVHGTASNTTALTSIDANPAQQTVTAFAVEAGETIVPVSVDPGITIFSGGSGSNSVTYRVAANSSGRITVKTNLGTDDHTLYVCPVGGGATISGALVTNTLEIPLSGTGNNALSGGFVGTGTAKIRIASLPSNGSLYRVQNPGSSDTALTVGETLLSTAGRIYFKPNSGVTSSSFTYYVVDEYDTQSQSAYTATLSVTGGGNTSTTVTASNYTLDFYINGTAAKFFDSSKITKNELVTKYKFTGVRYFTFGSADGTAAGTFGGGFKADGTEFAYPGTSMDTFTYQPPTNDVGRIEVDYTVYDASGAASSATITLMVRPVARNDVYSTNAGQWLSVSSTYNGLAGNDVYPSSYPYTVKKTRDPSYGSLSLSDNGTFTYMPSNNTFNGVDNYARYRVVSKGIESNEGTITINVGTGSGGTSRFQTKTDTPLNVTASEGLLSGLGTGYSIQRSANSSSYFTNVNSDGSFSFVPPSGQSGVFTLYYLLYAPNGSYTNESISVDVMPVAISTAYNATSGTAFSISATEAATKNKGSNLRANVVTSPSHGTLTLNADGTFTYTPTSGYTGSDYFTYTVTDTVANLTSALATVTFNVASSGTGGTVDSGTTGGISTDDGEIGIAITGESDWLAYLLYSLGAIALLIGGRVVYLSLRKPKSSKQ